MMRKNVLVTGATGKQGSALIRALLQPSSPDSNPSAPSEYHIYALTRKVSSPSAQSLLQTHDSQNITLVEGDLDNQDSILTIFETAKLDGDGIWGVFAVLAFPGLGAAADGEERQGKMLADVALEYKVEVFVYSSAMRAGPKYEDQLDWKPSGKAKKNVEEHCRALGERGLRWIILRPSLFMENFDEFIGSIAVAIMKKGMQEDTTLALIASEDIGNVAAGVFRNRERYLHHALVLAAETATMSQIQDSYKRATGKSIPAVPGAFGWMLVKMNKATQDLIKDMEQNHYARASGDYPELEGEVALANSAYKMRTYYEWVKEKQEKKEVEREEIPKREWNQVSLGKLLTGRS